MEELKVFIGFHVRFLKDCIKKGLLKEENKQLLTEYRNKLIDMASVLNKDGAVKTSGFTLQWYKTVTTTSTTTTAISGETSSTLSVTSTMGLDASYTCVVN